MRLKNFLMRFCFQSFRDPPPLIVHWSGSPTVFLSSRFVMPPNFRVGNLAAYHPRAVALP